MEKQLELAIGQVVGLGEQLVTLSSAILVLTVSFAKDVLKTPTRSQRKLLAAAWCGYLLTIVAGMWLRMAVAGSLASSTPFVSFEPNVEIPAGVQILLFVGSTVVLLVLAVKGLASR